MTNYYEILGIKPFEENQEVIISAYKDLTAKFETKLTTCYEQLSTEQTNYDEFRDKLIVINTAFLVLSDKILKVDYDKALCISDSSSVDNQISEKRKEAEKFIDSKLPKPHKKKMWSKKLGIIFIALGLFCFIIGINFETTVVRGSIVYILIGVLLLCWAKYRKYQLIKKGKEYHEVGWGKLILNTFLVILVIGFIGRAISTIVGSLNSVPTNLEVYNPNGWEQYDFYDSFSIKIPPTMEQRTDDDSNTQLLTDNNFTLNPNIVFQQKGLSEMADSAKNTYCRVLIEHVKCHWGECNKYNETPNLTKEDIAYLRELTDAELGGTKYVDEPKFRWVQIANINALEASYKRTGLGATVSCKIYWLSNTDETVKIVVAYRDCDASLWKTDLGNIIRTFRWKRLK